MTPDEQVVDLLQKLVRIESINPALDPRGSGEGKVADALAEFCRAHKITFETQPVLDGRSNFLASVSGRDPSRRIIFVAHMDTVPTQTWTSDPFSGIEANGRLHGRGSCDTKAALAAMMVALSTVQQGQPAATIVVAGSVDEEHRKAGARAIARSGIRYDAAIVGEPTNLDLIVAHKGSVRWQIEVIGRPAHTSKPDLGINAITGMAKVITELQALNQSFAARADPLVGSPTLTVSLIEGGVEVTTVPPSCRIWVDRRLIPGERPKDAVVEVNDILQGLRNREPQLDVRSLPVQFEDPPPDSSAGTRIADLGAKACARTAGRGEPKGVPYGTDASQLSLAGIPCIIVGPGSIDQAHTNDEFVSISELQKAVQIYRQIMLDY